jgi:hypothetical protein
MVEYFIAQHDVMKETTSSGSVPVMQQYAISKEQHVSNTSKPTIEWTREKAIAFYKKLYNCVHGDGMDDDDVFTFEGHEFVISYAKYLSEYLADQFHDDYDEDPDRQIPRDGSDSV